MDNLLEYKRVSFNILGAADRGSGAKGDLSTWRPDLPDEWYYLGQAASANWTTSPESVIVRALQPDVLKDVVDWELVWSSQGSGTSTCYAFWRGIPPSDTYAVVGGIFSTNPSWARPTQEQTSGIKAVRKDALKAVDGTSMTGTLSEVWMDKGSGATRHGSAWMVVPHPDYPSDVSYTFSMIPAGDDGDWKQPSLESCYTFAATRTIYSTNALLAWQIVSANNLVGSDPGFDEGAFATWRPDLPDGWYRFGYTCNADDTTPPRTTIVMGLQPDVLKDVISWQLTWRDTDYIHPLHSTWNGIPPSDEYSCLATISIITTTDPPTEDQTAGIKTIRKDVLAMLAAVLSSVSDETGSGYILPPETA